MAQTAMPPHTVNNNTKTNEIALLKNGSTILFRG